MFWIGIAATWLFVIIPLLVVLYAHGEREREGESRDYEA